MIPHKHHTAQGNFSDHKRNWLLISPWGFCLWNGCHKQLSSWSTISNWWNGKYSREKLQQANHNASQKLKKLLLIFISIQAIHNLYFFCNKVVDVRLRWWVAIQPHKLRHLTYLWFHTHITLPSGFFSDHRGTDCLYPLRIPVREMIVISSFLVGPLYQTGEMEKIPGKDCNREITIPLRNWKK